MQFRSARPPQGVASRSRRKWHLEDPGYSAAEGARDPPTPKATQRLHSWSFSEKPHMSFYFRSEIAQTNKASKQPSAALRIVRSTLAWLETRCQKECGNFGINSKIGVLQPSSPYRPCFIWSMVVFQQETGTPCRSGRIYAYVCYVQFTKSTLLPNNQCDIYSNEHLDNMTKAADLEQRENLQPAENSSIIAAWPQAVILLSVKWTAQFPHPADASGRGVVFISLLRVSCYKSIQRLRTYPVTFEPWTTSSNCN